MNKKSILGLLAVVMIAAVAALNVSLNSQKETLSDLAMENVEALALENTDPWPPGDGKTSMTYNCYDKYGRTKGYGRSCFSPGYRQSCIPQGCQ